MVNGRVHRHAMTAALVMKTREPFSLSGIIIANHLQNYITSPAHLSLASVGRLRMLGESITDSGARIGPAPAGAWAEKAPNTGPAKKQVPSAPKAARSLPDSGGGSGQGRAEA